MTSARTVAITSLMSLLMGLNSPAYACDQRSPTRETSPGPHDYAMGSANDKLWREGDSGEPLFLRARIVDTCGSPVDDARVQILHANAEGYHEADRWRASLVADEEGEFKVVTVFPGYTGGLPRHIHFIITHPHYRQLITRLYFKNDPSADASISDLAMILEEVQRGDSKGWVAGYEFVLAPK